MHVMAMIDPATGWLEVALLKAAPAADAMQKLFDEYWAARCPRPREVGFDDGGEFKAEFADLCASMGAAKKPSSSWNPQSNAMLERAHQVLGGMMRAFELGGQVLDENEQLQKFLADTAYAARSTYLTAQQAAPAPERPPKANFVEGFKEPVSFQNLHSLPSLQSGFEGL